MKISLQQHVNYRVQNQQHYFNELPANKKKYIFMYVLERIPK